MTRAVIKTITDANLSVTSDFTTADLALISGLGPSTPAGGGKRLITTYQVDAQGRTVEETDPAGEVTYTVYNDAAHEVRTYPGWNAATDQTTGPVQDSREDMAGNYTETLTYVWTGAGGLPVNAQGQPTGTESLTDPNTVIQSLSRSLMNPAGQVTQSLEYTSLPSSGYSTSRTLGTKGTNYLETDTYFDSLGRAAATYEPSGTIDHTFFDTNGNVVAEWQGTCDIPTADYDGDGDNGAYDADDFRAWVAQNPTATVGPAGTNMVKISGSVYDGGQAGGDGLLTESDSYYGSGSGNYYASNYQYDWQDRQTGSLGPDGVAEIDTLDNLGDTTRSQTYAESSYNSGTGQIVTGNLRSQSTTLLDPGTAHTETREYEVNVNPTTGAGTAGDYLPTDTWYDPRGLVVKTVTGNGHSRRRATRDGREVFSYTCYDANESPTNYSGP